MSRPIAWMMLLALVVPRLSFGIDPLTGVWRGEMAGGPAVELKLKNVNGAWTGQAVFYLIRKTDGDTTRTASPATPILHGRLEGKVFRFDVEVNSESVPMKMDLISEDEGSLVNLADRAMGAVKVVRTR